MYRVPTFVLFFVVSAAFVSGSEYRSGRATFFHGIHHGSCGFGQLDYNKGTGWNVAAISDQHYEYVGSCGKCYEVRCRPASFSDRFGNHMDRSHACYDPEKSIIVSIVDTCPCHYPGNQYSNSRWCCQDQDHLDLSNVAFDHLAEQKWGVIGIEYRPVECPNGPAQGYYPQDHYGAPNQQVIAFDDNSENGK